MKDIVPFEPILSELSSLSKRVSVLSQKAEEREYEAPESVEVNNLDEIKKHLRDELDRFSKSLAQIVNSKEQPTLLMPDSINIGNMDELKKVLLNIARVAAGLDQKIAKMNFEPKVNITVPEIKVPEITIPEFKEIKLPTINVPETKVTVNPEVNLDLRPLLAALQPLKYLSDRPNKPIAVRMSDGDKFTKAVQALQKSTDQLGVVYAGSSGLTTDDLRSAGMYINGSVGDGSKTVTTAGTRVQLSTSSVSCRKVKLIALAANTGTMWVGGATVANGRGEPLVAQQSTDWIETNNLSNIYIDSTVNGEGVSFIYV